MGMTRREMLGATAAVLTAAHLNEATPKKESCTGVYVVTSGGDQIDAYFRNLAGRSNFVFIPTAAPFLTSKRGVVWNPDREKNRELFVNELKERFGVPTLDILHTRSRDTANTERFAAMIRNADTVWISGGLVGLLADAYLDTRVMSELRYLIRRGGILVGESAGAMILGSYIVRGNPEQPILMAEGHDRGFGFLENIVINPHLTDFERENELTIVVNRYPHLLGLGVDDDTALVVRGDVAQVVGSGRVAVYDHQKHGERKYSWLKAGDKLDLVSRSKALRPTQEDGDPVASRQR
jgi:cyanophycinase